MYVPGSTPERGTETDAPPGSVTRGDPTSAPGNTRARSGRGNGATAARPPVPAAAASRTGTASLRPPVPGRAAAATTPAPTARMTTVARSANHGLPNCGPLLSVPVPAGRRGPTIPGSRRGPTETPEGAAGCSRRGVRRVWVPPGGSTSPPPRMLSLARTMRSALVGAVGKRAKRDPTRLPADGGYQVDAEKGAKRDPPGADMGGGHSFARSADDRAPLPSASRRPGRGSHRRRVHLRLAEIHGPSPIRLC
jgi:hypothetical protein